MILDVVLNIFETEGLSVRRRQLGWVEKFRNNRSLKMAALLLQIGHIGGRAIAWLERGVHLG